MIKNTSTPLSQEFPEFLLEWHPDNPPIEHTSKGATTKFKWVCSNNHVWEQSPNSRLSGFRARGVVSGCPYCSGRYVITGVNDLATTHPHLISEWSTENKQGPHQVKTYSRKTARWTCQYGHGWETVISNRTANGSGCPDCARRNKSSAEIRALCSFSRFGEVRSGVPISRGVVDIYMPTIHLVVEYDGQYFHKNNILRDKERSIELLSKYALIRVRELGLPSLEIGNPNYLEITLNPTIDQDDFNNQVDLSASDFLHSHQP